MPEQAQNEEKEEIARSEGIENDEEEKADVIGNQQKLDLSDDPWNCHIRTYTFTNNSDIDKKNDFRFFRFDETTNSAITEDIMVGLADNLS